MLAKVPFWLILAIMIRYPTLSIVVEFAMHVQVAVDFTVISLLSLSNENFQATPKKGEGEGGGGEREKRGAKED